jgi:hypothetical protein
MARPGYRATLENGPKLDINALARRGFIRPGAATPPTGISWTGYWGEVASGTLTADLSGRDVGWVRVKLANGLDQYIETVARLRHFGGRQWFFVCPYLHRRCMVLWMPPGARDFSCRQRWGPRRVAYASQFCDRTNRAHRAKAKINARLCRLGGFDPDEWDFPPKPTWMRWAGYRREENRFDFWEERLNEGLVELLAKFKRRGWL